ncbi:MAG: BMP family ABC transporter substrate-binding protein, partial [Candidatus Thorarchaeota archaeon]
MSQRSSIVTSLVIIIIVCGSVGGLLLMTNPYEPSRVAIVVMDPGFGDLSTADNIQFGMDEAGLDVAVQYHVPEVLPTSVSEAQTIMNDLSATGQYDLIIAIGAEMASAVQTVAENYPNQKFGMIGAPINEDNVASATFASEQSSFLAGVLAAFQAAEDGYTSRVGIIAAMENDATLEPMIDGF